MRNDSMKQESYQPLLGLTPLQCLRAELHLNSGKNIGRICKSVFACRRSAHGYSESVSEGCVSCTHMSRPVYSGEKDPVVAHGK